MKRVLTIAMIAGLAMSGQEAAAATATASLAVNMTINAQCLVTGGTLAFPSSGGIISANVDASTTISVQCTSTTPYTVALGAGAGSGATVAARKMTSSANTLTYSLYQDSARATVWGTTGAALYSGTGTGSSQAITVYGRVTPQNVPAGSYADTVSIDVTY